MAKAQKFAVTHPDGTVSTRSSKTMTYTHALVLVASNLADRVAANEKAAASTGSETTTAWYRSRIEHLKAAQAHGAVYEVLRWSQSAAAAAKAANDSQFRNLVRDGERLEVVPVEKA